MGDEEIENESPGWERYEIRTKEKLKNSQVKAPLMLVSDLQSVSQLVDNFDSNDISAIAWRPIKLNKYSQDFFFMFSSAWKFSGATSKQNSMKRNNGAMSWMIYPPAFFPLPKEASIK